MQVFLLFEFSIIKIPTNDGWCQLCHKNKDSYLLSSYVHSIRNWHFLSWLGDQKVDNLNEHFVILEPDNNLSIFEFYTVQKRRSMDLEALKLEKKSIRKGSTKKLEFNLLKKRPGT